MELFIFARFHARHGSEDEAAAVLRDQAKHVRQEAGCLAIDIFVSARNPHLFYLHSHWVDEESFNVHAELASTIQFVARMESLINHPFDATRSFRLD